MKSTLSIGIGAALIGASALAATHEIDVMTQNQYLGADLTPALNAATAQPFDDAAAAAFNAAVVGVLRTIAANRPAQRVEALAEQIERRRPDVVGLQEAYEFACLPDPGAREVPGKGCDDPSIKAAFTDHLQDTAAALRGKYVVAGKVTNLKIDVIPFTINGVTAILAFADRDAILVRKGLPAKWVDFGPTGTGTCAKPSDQGCNYLTSPDELSTPLGPIKIERGFLAVDLRVKGRDYRVFNTHLEQRLLAPGLDATRLLQVGQAWELAGAALGTWNGGKTVIVVGDLNSAPVDTIPVPPYPAYLPWAPSLPVAPPYWIFAGNGFTDAWTLRHGNRHDEGFTCCQAEDLRNRKSQLYERIDIIFSLTRPSQVIEMKVLGERMGDKTRPPGHGGLWPADHAAVAAELHFD